MVAAEAGLRALVTAADDFAAPLVAAQRAALDDAVAAAGATPPSAFEGVRSEFEAKLRELEGAIAAGLAKERAAIDALGASARAAGEDTAEAVAARFDPARVALGERLQASRAAAETTLAWLESKRPALAAAAAAAALAQALPWRPRPPASLLLT